MGKKPTTSSLVVFLSAGHSRPILFSHFFSLFSPYTLSFPRLISDKNERKKSLVIKIQLVVQILWTETSDANNPSLIPSSVFFFSETILR